MPTTMTVTRSVTVGGLPYSRTNEYLLDGVNIRTALVPPTTNDKQVLLNVESTAIKAMYLVSDQDVTLETNSASSPIDTIALKANVPLIWTEDDDFDCPISADVTMLYITNAGSTEANVSIVVGEDATP